MCASLKHHTRNPRVWNVKGVPASGAIGELGPDEISGLLQDEAFSAHMHTPYPDGDPTRGVYCSRTINVRAIKVIGYDMDYTLVRYHMALWEARAYHYAKQVDHTTPNHAMPCHATSHSTPSVCDNPTHHTTIHTPPHSALSTTLLDWPHYAHFTVCSLRC